MVKDRDNEGVRQTTRADARPKNRYLPTSARYNHTEGSEKAFSDR